MKYFLKPSYTGSSTAAIIPALCDVGPTPFTNANYFNSSLEKPVSWKEFSTPYARYRTELSRAYPPEPSDPFEVVHLLKGSCIRTLRTSVGFAIALLVMPGNRKIKITVAKFIFPRAYLNLILGYRTVWTNLRRRHITCWKPGSPPG
jgi:hypothetical protein